MPPTIKTYQVSWTDNYQTELPPPPTWEEKGKGRAKEELQSSSLGYELVPTHKEQEQRLADLNTKLCNYCLIPCHFQYCNECDFMFNPPPRILFPITELPEPEKEVLITENMLFQNPTENTKTEQYLMYPNLSKELELKCGRGNVPVNFTEEDSDQIEFIHTNTIISILPCRQYILKVNRKIQNQALLFEASPKICFLADVANLYLPAKAHKHFKIPIHNPTKDVIEIPEGTLNLPKESYLFTSEEINKLNLGNLNTLQQMQLKVFLNEYANVFASENKFGCTDIVKHQIDTGDARPIKQ
ncbi:hypothetical protein G9A89_023622 [Geosiphon pyriformis]|nr:hypothetical protein G9A89_023622 [Geosiphon pyriformis]